MCHGVGEYMGRYEELGSHLSQNGLLMFGHDHGELGFLTVHINSYIMFNFDTCTYCAGTVCVHISKYVYMYHHVLACAHEIHVVGHGRSEGDRVYVEDIDTYVQDVIHHVELMKSDYPHLPCILMGHSMVHAHVQYMYIHVHKWGQCE